MKFKVYTIAAEQSEVNKYKWDILYKTPTNEVKAKVEYYEELVQYDEVKDKLAHLHVFNDMLAWYDCDEDDDDNVDLRSFILTDESKPILELVAV